MAKNTIILKNYLNIFEEYVANAAITPGMLIEVMSTEKVKKHATGGGNVLVMVAKEDELQGNGIDTNYAAGDVVSCWIPQRGDIGNLLLRDEETIVIGDFLESDGEGRVRKHVADMGDSHTGTVQNAIIGIAVDAKDLSTLPEGSDSSAGGAYYNPRIQVRFI